VAEEWAKLHTSILGDGKLMRAARKGAKGLEMLPWLFAFAKAEGHDGRLEVSGEPAEPADIAALIPGNPVKAVAQCMASCESNAVKMLVRDEDDVLCFVSWERRQSVRQSDTPEAINERVRRHREKKRAERNGEQRSETGETSLQGGDETASNALDLDRDLDRDTEEDQKHSSPDGDASRPGTSLALVGQEALTGSQVAVKRTVEAILSKIAGAMADIAEGVEERLDVERFRATKAELVFSYWATKYNHRDSLYDS
jgi:hypothetical protein